MADFAGPLGLTIYVLALSGLAFGCSVRGLPWWYQLVVAIMPVVSITCLWLTNLVDPGIIPPRSEKDAVIELLDDGHNDMPDYSRYGKDSKGRWTRMIQTEDGHADSEKYCSVCNIWRHRRGYHCFTCGHCMERGDHHCGFMGNCVAKLNHRFFAAFLCLACAGCTLMMGGSIWRLKRIDFPDNKDVWKDVETYFLLLLAAFYGYHALMLVFGVCHGLGIVFDLTTKDIAAQGEIGDNPPCLPGRRNPRALLRMWRAVCCGPIMFKQGTLVRPVTEAEMQNSSSSRERSGWV